MARRLQQSVFNCNAKAIYVFATLNIFYFIKEKKMKKRMLSGLICLAMLALLSGIAVAAEESIIVGTITEDNQIITQDGQAYMIKQNKQADDIIAFVGKKAQIKGTVLEADGKKTIEIVSYELIEETQK
jgi:hypothetical protein